jgi:hypothetical protein
LSPAPSTRGPCGGTIWTSIDRTQLEHPVATYRIPALRPWSRRLGALVSVFIVTLSLGGALAGCSNGSDESIGAQPTAVSGAAGTSVDAVSVPLGSMTMPTAQEVEATWNARPGYVNALPADWQAAYSFALARPDVLQWLPCYCGCTGIPHRSNLDCFFQRREVKGTYSYEEHASYCDICIKTANMASDMLLQGKTMVQIRAAVDSTFSGGAAPGTDTPMPPA